MGSNPTLRTNLYLLRPGCVHGKRGIVGARGALGFLLGIVIGNLIGVPITVSINLWMMGITFAVVTSVLAGYWPAWRVANLNPVEALRHE